jgi:hypothetical protein
MNNPAVRIPAYLLRQTPVPRYLVADDGSLTITTGEQTIVLERADIARLRDFVNRFEQEPSHA